LRMVLI